MMPKNKNLYKSGYKSIGNDLLKANKVYSNTLDFGPLSRVDASRSNDIQNLLNQYSSLSDPNSSSYAGKRSSEISDYVQRLKDLTEGYSSSEFNALRDERRRGIERGFQGGSAALARGQSGRLGATQRAAQLAQLARNYGQSSTDAEQDLFVKGADFKRDAISNYGNTVTSLDTSERDRGRQALADYRAALEKDYEDRLGREKTNLGQEAVDRALKYGGVLGVQGIREARLGARRQSNQFDKYLNTNKQIAESNYGAAAAQQQAYFDNINKLLEQFK